MDNDRFPSRNKFASDCRLHCSVLCLEAFALVINCASHGIVFGVESIVPSSLIGMLIDGGSYCNVAWSWSSSCSNCLFGVLVVVLRYACS